jgi:PKD repeat protein
MRASSTLTVATLCAAAMFAACTVHKTEAPPLSGPSEFALSLTMTATPDSISQDGGSQSSVRIAARGPDGRPLTGLPMRVDTTVNGVAQDFGTLSARTIVTGSDGVASVIYTAPRQSQGVNSGTCNGLPGTCVTVVATATGSNFEAANPQVVTIRLVPPGVILPPADTPTARFEFTPTSTVAGQPVLFDATGSCGGPISTSGCTSSNSVVKYDWDFGDGATGSGATVAHVFSGSVARSFAVTLTVTNDRGLAASATKIVPLTTSPPPTASFVFSPNDPAPNTLIIFTDTSKPVPGRNNVRFDWNFGDPDKPSGGVASGANAQNTYTREGTFVVTLTVTDDLDQRSVATQSVNVKVKTTGSLAPSVSVASPPDR